MTVTCHVNRCDPEREHKCTFCNNVGTRHGGIADESGFAPWDHDACLKEQGSRAAARKRLQEERLIAQGKCVWHMAYIGYCGEHPHMGYGRQTKDGDGKALPGTNYCAMHTKKCAMCPEPAVAECDATFALVCGAPLCKEHRGRHHG